MLEVLLMRHAKSEHPRGVPDRARPLADRGRRAAALVGLAITEYDAIPSRILTSPAIRARTTADLARSAGGWAAPVEVVDDLYDGGIRGVLAAVAGMTGRVLAVGHEPTWSMTVETLIGGGSIRMVTAAVACVEIPERVVPGGGTLRWMIHPRLLE